VIIRKQVVNFTTRARAYRLTPIADLASALRHQLHLRSTAHQPPHLGAFAMSTNTTAASPAERYDVLVVDNYEDAHGAEKASWTRVGVAFAHKDGHGLNVELQAIPVSGKLVIRRHEAKPKAK
jgi:hypothetical protein